MAENPRIAEFRAIKDPTDRARRCQEFLVNGRETIKSVERLRDDAIREARATADRPTVDALTKAIGVKRNVVVNALRSLP
jgi:predicted transcriptional regulator